MKLPDYKDAVHLLHMFLGNTLDVPDSVFTSVVSIENMTFLISKVVICSLRTYRFLHCIVKIYFTTVLYSNMARTYEYNYSNIT